MPPSPLLCAAVLILALAGPAWSQTPGPDAPSSAPPAAEAESPQVEHEIEIIAHLPGPALWRVSTPKSELWIIGLVGPVPKRMAWDTRRVEAALNGARELVIPPGASINIIDIAGLLLDPFHRYHYPGRQTLRGTLTPEARERFETAAASAGQDPAHYDHWRPLVAAVALLADAQKHDALNPQGPQKTLMQLARANIVSTRRLANYSIGELVRAFNNAPPDASDICLELAVGLVPRLPALSARIGESWAHGDIEGARQAQAEFTSDRCFTSVPGMQKLQDKMTEDWVKGLAQTLQQPGKTVLAIDMDTLTRSGGLLDQLRAQGLDVTGHAY